MISAMVTIGKAYSDDIRWRIVYMSQIRGLKAADIASLTFVSKRTVQRYVERYKVTGDVAQFVRKNGPARMLTDREEALIVQAVLNKPGVCLHEIQTMLQVSGIQVDTSTICRTLHRLGFTYQKIKHLPLQRSDNARQAFMAEVSVYDPSMFIWLDETGCDRRNAVRQYGYGLRGMTPRSFTFKSWGKRYTAIAAMSLDGGLEDVYLTEGNVNGDEFLNYVRRSLLPLLMPFNGANPKSVVIMDNASIHHVEEIESTIRGVGALVLFLPPYSPDLNPVEEVFAEVKHSIQLNDTVFQSTANPRVLISMAFAEVSQEHCLSYIKDSGYIE